MMFIVSDIYQWRHSFRSVKMNDIQKTKECFVVQALSIILAATEVNLRALAIFGVKPLWISASILSSCLRN